LGERIVHRVILAAEVIGGAAILGAAVMIFRALGGI
jgi:hypothetical protein